MKDRKTFEHKAGERTYHFTCDNDSPLNEVKDALCYLITHMVNYEQAMIVEMQKKKLEEEKKDEQ